MAATEVARNAKAIPTKRDWAGRTALCTEIRLVEYVIMTAPAPYVVTGYWADDPARRYSYGVNPRKVAQARLDALCRVLGQITDDA